MPTQRITPRDRMEVGRRLGLIEVDPKISFSSAWVSRNFWILILDLYLWCHLVFFHWMFRSLWYIERDPRLNMILVGDRCFSSSQIKGLTGSNDARMWPSHLPTSTERQKVLCSKRCKGQTSVVQHVVQLVIVQFVVHFWVPSLFLSFSTFKFF